jgi:hypothetical protein
LFCTPFTTGILHIFRRLNGRNELKYRVGDTDNPDDGAGDDADGGVVEEKRSDENVD